MPHYIFEVRHGIVLEGFAGLDCLDDEDAKAKARALARELAAHKYDGGQRQVAIRTEGGDGVSIVPVLSPN